MTNLVINKSILFLLLFLFIESTSSFYFDFVYSDKNITKNRITLSKLYDEKGKVYQIKETINAISGITINEINDGKKNYQIVHIHEQKSRLFILDNQCNLIDWKYITNPWFQKTNNDFNIDPYLLDFLLVGPHYLHYNLELNFCSSVQTFLTTERGMKMRQESCSLSWLGTWIDSYKPIAGEMPVKITFRGKNLWAFSELFASDVVDQVDVSMIPSGFGCPSLWNKRVVYKVGSLRKIRFTLTTFDRDLGEQTVKQKIFIDTKKVYLISESLTNEEAIIMDYRLGVEYVFDQSKKNGIKCQIETLKSDHLKLVYQLFDERHTNFIGKDFQYLGYSLCENDEQIECTSWEKVESKTFESTFYDKLVTTITASKKASWMSFYNPFSFTITGYILENGKLKKKLYRKSVISELTLLTDYDDDESKYKVSYCFEEPEKRAVYSFLLSPTWSADYLRNLKDSQTIKLRLKEYFSQTLAISMLRIDDVDVSVNHLNYFDINILFLDSPDIMKSFSSRDVKIDEKYLSNGQRKILSRQCFQEAVNSGLRFFFDCNQNQKPICYMFKGDNLDNLPAGNLSCKVYENKAFNPFDLKNEIKIDDIKSLIARTIKQYPNLKIMIDGTDRKLQFLGYFRNDIKSNPINNYLPETVLTEDAFNYKRLTGLSWHDCYESCKKSSNIPCSMFSFCSNEKDSAICIQSSSIVMKENWDLITQHQEGCSTNSMNSLSMFTQKFIGNMQINDFIETVSEINLEECSNRCSQNNDCKNFAICYDQQYTEPKYCYLMNDEVKFGYNEREVCAVYQENNLYLFNETGNDLADRVFATYNNVSYRQCSSICRQSRQIQCLSFNYCHLTRECELAESSTTNKAKSKASDKCFNYIFTGNIVANHNSDASLIVQEQSYSIVAGSISIFVLFGLLTGFAALIAFNRYQKWRLHRTSDAQTLSWNRENEVNEIH